MLCMMYVLRVRASVHAVHDGLAMRTLATLAVSLPRQRVPYALAMLTIRAQVTLNISLALDCLTCYF